MNGKRMMSSCSDLSGDNSSWISDDDSRGPSWFEKILIRILSVGEIPRHVAFIMDGNRRYARKLQEAPIKGHESGFLKLGQTLHWCHLLNIPEVTVYAFSIENYKRSPEEVEGLMELSRQKFKQIVQEKDKLRDYGVKVRILGDTSLLPHDLQKLIREAEDVTKMNDKRTLNVAFSYTSRRELSQAIKLTSNGVAAGLLKPQDITDELLERCFYTRYSSNTDLLIRTSGELRLSDFLLWQTSWSVTYFTSILWPDFTLKHLLAGIFYYQRNKRKIDTIKPAGKITPPTSTSEMHSDYLNSQDIERDRRIAKFIQSLDTELINAS